MYHLGKDVLAVIIRRPIKIVNEEQTSPPHLILLRLVGHRHGRVVQCGVVEFA